MTKHVYRIITLIAVCTMFAAALSYSRAMAENPGDLAEESNICALDTTLDIIDTVEVAPVSSAVAASDDVVINACTWASCRTSADCPQDHPAAPFFCNPNNNCCAPW